MSHEAGPFVLHELIVDVPVDSDDGNASRPPKGRDSGPESSGETASQGRRASIECVYAAGLDILVGTSDGYLVHYQAGSGLDDRPAFVRKKLVSQSRKSIDDIVILPEQRKVLVLVDATLLVLELATLSSPISGTNHAFKGVSAICLDSAVEPSEGKLSFARRRNICNCEMTAQGLIVTKEINLTVENVITVMRRQGSSICFADGQGFKLLDLDVLSVAPLFPHDRTVGVPLVDVMDSSEFLLATGGQKQDGMGVFVSSTGEPASRGTLQWHSYPKAIALQAPYVLSLVRRTVVQINNVDDERFSQTVQLPLEARDLALWRDASSTGSSGVRGVLVPAKSAIWILRSLPIQEELNRLIRAGQAGRAAAFLEQSLRRTYGTQEEMAPALREGYINMGLYMMSQTMFDDALATFKQVYVDPRSLLPLVPEVADIVREKLLDDRDDLVSRFGTIQMMVVAYLNETFPDADESFGKEFVLAGIRMLTDYLLWYRALPRMSKEVLETCDTALVAMYLETDPSNVYPFLVAPNNCDIAITLGTLESRQKHYAASLLYHGHGMPEQAWAIWKRLLDGSVADSDFPGPETLGPFLLQIRDPVLFWDKARMIFDNDQSAGLQMLKSLPLDDPRLEPDKTLDFLSQYGRKSTVSYLEWLVETTGSMDARLHTQLALMYLEDVLDLAGSTDQIRKLDDEFRHAKEGVSFIEYVVSRTDSLSSARARLLRFLQSSNHIRTPAFLAKLGTVGDMVPERALIMAKSGEHERALRLLVHDLSDFVGAEELCSRLATDNRDHAATPFSLLLHLYLGIKDDTVRATQVIRLLNNPSNSAHVSDVIGSLPGDWALAITFPYLKRSLRSDQHALRYGAVETNLSKVDNLKVAGSRVEMIRSLPVTRVAEDVTLCLSCGKPIVQPYFVRLDTSDPPRLLHIQCHTSKDK